MKKEIISLKKSVYEELDLITLFTITSILLIILSFLH